MFEIENKPGGDCPSETPADKLRLPPEGTSVGYRRDDGTMWFACTVADDDASNEEKPGIAVCEYAGNYLNPPLYRTIAVFEPKKIVILSWSCTVSVLCLCGSRSGITARKSIRGVA